MTGWCQGRDARVTARSPVRGFRRGGAWVNVRPPMKTAATLAFAALGLLLGGTATAQTVTLNGHIGAHKALLVIDGEPQTVAVGSTVRGVRLLSLGETQAEVEVAGARRSLTLGAGAVRASGPSRSSGNEIVLAAGRNGHFRGIGQINGKSIEFMVDTGASVVSLGQVEADRLGLDYRNGAAGLARTANGVVPTRSIVLTSVRIGDVEVANVEASVHPGSLGIVLLGNSFLTRFQMKRENDVMRLEKRN
jgi:aspartyl protease family protein